MRKPRIHLIINHGFTLVEFMIYSAIVAVVLFAATEIMVAVLRQNSKLAAMAEVTANSRAALDRATLAVRNAESVTSPVAGATSSRLVLAMAVAALNPTIITSQGGALYLKEGAAATTSLISDDVSMQVTFQNLTATGTQGTILLASLARASSSGVLSEFNFVEYSTTTAGVRRRP